MIGGDHYYFRHHLAGDVVRTIKRTEIARVTALEPPHANAFEVRHAAAGERDGWFPSTLTNPVVHIPRCGG